MLLWLLMIPPASGKVPDVRVRVDAPFAEWMLAGRFDTPEQCDEKRQAFSLDGQRLAALKSESFTPLADAEIHAQCLKWGDLRLGAALNQKLPLPFWQTSFTYYPNQTASRVMISSILIMPPAAEDNRHRGARVNAPLSEWNLAGDFSAPEECEDERRKLNARGKREPIAQSAGLKPLAEAEMNAKCVNPDDPSLKDVLPWHGLMEPPMLDVNYLQYPDRESRDYVSVKAKGALISHENQAVTFPNATNKSESPNGRYVLVNIDHPNEVDTDYDWHSIFLVDTKTGGKTLFYKYGRGVAVVWSPNSNAVVVNDYWGSNVSRSVLFALNRSNQRVDIGQMLMKSNRPQREKESIKTADHVYASVVKWLNDKTVIFKIYGYNGVDPDGFKLVYAYDVAGSSFSLLEYAHHADG